MHLIKYNIICYGIIYKILNNKNYVNLDVYYSNNKTPIGRTNYF